MCVFGVCVCFLHQWAAAPLHHWCSPPWCLPESRRGSRRGLWSPAACLQHRTAFITASHQENSSVFQRTQKPTMSNILLFNIIFMYLLYILCSIWLKCNNMLVSFILAKCKTYLLYCYFYSTFTNWFDVFLFVWPLKSCTEVLLYSSAIIIKNKRVNRCSRIKLFSGEMSRQFPPSH